MKLSLVIQCIGTWDYTPVESSLEILLNNIRYPYVKKTGGLRIFTAELPVSFMLTIRSKDFYTYTKFYKNIPGDKIISVQLIPKWIKSSHVTWLTVDNPTENTKIVLGYDYFRLSSAIHDGIIYVENKHRQNLEGRDFLLRDTAGGNEEFITLSETRDVLFLSFNATVMYIYEPKTSVLLPSITLPDDENSVKLPLNIPDGETVPVWVYSPDAKRHQIKRGQEIHLT